MVHVCVRSTNSNIVSYTNDIGHLVNKLEESGLLNGEVWMISEMNRVKSMKEIIGKM